jgi:hypothetical protein
MRVRIDLAFPRGDSGDSTGLSDHVHNEMPVSDVEHDPQNKDAKA